MTRTTTVVTALLLAGLAGLAGGCGGASGGGSDDRDASATRSATPSATASASPAPDEGVATVQYEPGDEGVVRVRIDSLRREGPFMTLNATVACVDAQGRPFDECSTQQAFAEQPGDNNAFAGVVAVDPVGQRAYSVVRDEEELLSDSYSSVLEPGMGESDPPRRVWARYAAPPAEVTALDLLLPEGGPRIADVPITAGGVDDSPPPAGVQAAEAPDFVVAPESTDATGLAMGDADIEARTTSRRRRVDDRRGRRTVTLAADVLFAFDSARLGGDGSATLAEVATQIADDASDGPVAVDGYTDAKGSDAYNLRLSRRRAETVRGALEGEVGGRELRARGRGEADPVAPNTVDGEDNPAGRRKNRRVTVGYTLGRSAPAAAATPTPSATSAPAEAPAPRSWTYSGASDEQSRLTATVRSLRRVGNLSLLQLDVRCDASETAFEDCGQQFVLGEPGQTGNDLSGVRVTDPAQDVTYFPATFASGFYDVVGTLTRFHVGDTRPLSLYLGSIPSTTTSVTVRLPNGGPQFAGVPVG